MERKGMGRLGAENDDRDREDDCVVEVRITSTLTPNQNLLICGKQIIIILVANHNGLMKS